MFKCESCGEEFFGNYVICPFCGKHVFVKSLAVRYERKLYSEEDIKCANCVYCIRQNGLSANYFCIMHEEDFLCSRAMYKTVSLSDSCIKFVQREK